MHRILKQWLLAPRLDRHQVVYIGGVSASGKSTSSRALAARMAWPLVHLDDLHKLLTTAGLSGQGDLDKSTRRISRQFVAEVLCAGGPCVIEGGWLAPRRARQLARRCPAILEAAYLGFEQLDVEHHLRGIRARQDHWLAQKNPAEARQWLRAQVQRSRWYRQQAERYGQVYIDCSDVSGATETVLERLQGLA